ncbi:MAG TPA: phenylalanine--tRNA ligase subunit alpha [Acidimicrobiales bacterium]|nr:phenylalanine--tRNA ligase subunit alpha [Acidimicrobiales bacterium]
MAEAPLVDQIAAIEAEAVPRIAAAATLDDLRALDGELLGKRSTLSTAKAQLGGLDPEARRAAGQAVNRVRESLQQTLAARRRELEAAARRQQLEAERLDLTEVPPGRGAGHLHLVTESIQRLEDVFVGMGFAVAEGPEVETDWHNFGALNFPPDHPARDMYDTLYVEMGEPGSTVLRTHTSPVQVRVMTTQEPPIYSVMPGRVFRQDTPDATHMPVFHQIEGLVIDRDITFADLAGTLDEFTKAYFGGDFASRLRPSYFPFTEPSAEYDIIRPDGSFLELGGCGMVHPNVLANCGIDPEEWQGFAFGFGIDRLAITRRGVDDLRHLFTNDIRFSTQF